MSVFGGNDLFAEFNDPVSEEDENNVSWEEANRWKEENMLLKRENAKLRKTLRILTQAKQIKICDPAKDGPTAQLLLYNNIVSRNERQSLEGLLRHCLSRSMPTNDMMLHPQRSALQCLCAGEGRMTDTERAFTITNSVQFYDTHFCLDQLGDPLRKNSTMPLKIPEYDRGCPDALSGEVERVEIRENRAMRTCFNCGEKDHQLKDCPTPKNYRAIQERKQKFLNMMSGSPQAGGPRYHADKDDNGIDARFAGFKPGVISQALRDALGISKRELPPYIYQMRMLGYPPGHLEEARIRSSGLSLYKGKGEDRSDSGAEDVPLDTDKIIDYPGFNVPPGKHVVDDCRRSGMLPMDERHSKDVMVSYHKHRNALLQKRRAEIDKKEELARKRHKPNHVVKLREDDVREIDMETSDVEDSGGDAIIVQSDEPPDVATEQKTPPRRVDVTKDDVEEPDESKGCHDGDGAATEEVTYVEEEEAEEGEVLSTTSSCIEIVEEQSLSDGFEIGDMDEDELELQRNKILKQLKLVGDDDSDDVVCVSDDGTPGQSEQDETRIDARGDVIDVLDNCSSMPPQPGSRPGFTVKDSPHDPVSSENSPGGLHMQCCSENISPDSPELGEAPTASPVYCDVKNSPDRGAPLALIPPFGSESPPARATDPSPESPQSQGKNITPPVVDLPDPSQSSTHNIAESPIEIGDSPASPYITPDPLSQLSSQEGDSQGASPSLPHRSRFARGITQFDNYYQESKSSGVYKRLRRVLKDSPKNKTKS